MGTKTNILPIKQWLLKVNYPLIIAGPCSAESEKQLSETANVLKSTGKVDILRAGLWKPRTRPDGFEGVGDIGLIWLNNIKKTTGLLTTVEVATPNHVEACLLNNVDILWIGARTVGNPFSIQEISQSLKGIDIPVMIKNPLNPELKLWVGAIERINQAGIKKIAAIHRGFYTFNTHPYRNAPIWEIPIELKRIIPEISIINDPSHIAGNRELVSSIAQTALDLEMEGLMIEVHPEPELALTDANQQLILAEFDSFIKKLIFRNEKGNKSFQHKLSILRTKIDLIDDELLRILFQRMEVVKQIGHYKKENNITILQLKRWNEIISSRLENASNNGLNKDFIYSLLEIIHQESIRLQNEIFNNKE